MFLIVALLVFSWQTDIGKWLRQEVNLPFKDSATASKETDAVIYKHIDENGVVHFTNLKPAETKNVQAIAADEYRVDTIKLREQLPAATALTPKKRAKKKKPLKKKQNTKTKDSIVLYTGNQCVYCKQAVAFFRSNNISFKEYNIEKSPEAKKKMRAAGGVQYVPFAVINGKKLHGFSEGNYRRALNLPETSKGKIQLAKAQQKKTRSRRGKT